jgi:phosphotransferase system IIB component
MQTIIAKMEKCITKLRTEMKNAKPIGSLEISLAGAIWGLEDSICDLKDYIAKKGILNG